MATAVIVYSYKYEQKKNLNVEDDRMRVPESQLSAKFSPISQLSAKFLSFAGLVDGKDSKNTQLVTKTA